MYDLARSRENRFTYIRNMSTFGWMYGAIFTASFEQFLGLSALAGRVLWIRVCPPVRPFRQFSWNWLISFFWNFVWCRGPYGDVWQIPIFFEKFSAKNGFFGFFRRIYSLVLSGNGVEWKYLWPFSSILRKQQIQEKSDSQVMAKNVVDQSDFSIL